MSLKSKPSEIKEIEVEMLKIATDINIKEIWIQYSKLLYSISFKSELVEIKEIEAKMLKIATDINIKEIWILYCKTLYNMSFEYELSGIKEIEVKMLKLANGKNIKEIWIKYSDLITCITALTDINETEDIINKFEKIVCRINTKSIWIKYLDLLNELVYKQEISSIEKRFKLVKKHLTKTKTKKTIKYIKNAIKYIKKKNNKTHLWLLDNWKEYYNENVNIKSGLRLKFDKDVDSEVVRACTEFCQWIEKDYYFPVRVPAYVKSLKTIKSLKGKKVFGTFWGPFNMYHKPHIKVASGDYEELLNKWGKDNALGSNLTTLAHEFTHYFQWINGIKFKEKQAIKYAKFILDEYASTREHP